MHKEHKAILDKVDINEQQKILREIEKEKNKAEKRKDPCTICYVEIEERSNINCCEH